MLSDSETESESEVKPKSKFQPIVTEKEKTKKKKKHKSCKSCCCKHRSHEKDHHKAEAYVKPGVNKSICRNILCKDHYEKPLIMPTSVDKMQRPPLFPSPFYHQQRFMGPPPHPFYPPPPPPTQFYPYRDGMPPYGYLPWGEYRG